MINTQAQPQCCTDPALWPVSFKLIEMKFRLTPPHNPHRQRSCGLYKQVRGCWQFKRNVPDDGQQATIPLFTRQTLHFAGFSIEGRTTIQMPGQRWRGVHQDPHADTVLGIVPGEATAEKLHLLQPSRAYGLWRWRAAVATVSPNLLPLFRDLLVQRCALGFQSPILASPTPAQLHWGNRPCQHIVSNIIHTIVYTTKSFNSCKAYEGHLS